MTDEILQKTTTIKLFFPDINREFVYTYPHSFEADRECEAMEQWYREEAPTLFALYGYGPMDVTIYSRGMQVGFYRGCYQETLFNSFFNEGGDPWHGRFWHFACSLIELRYNKDQEKLKAA